MVCIGLWGVLESFRIRLDFTVTRDSHRGQNDRRAVGIDFHITHVEKKSSGDERREAAGIPIFFSIWRRMRWSWVVLTVGWKDVQLVWIYPGGVLGEAEGSGIGIHTGASWTMESEISFERGIGTLTNVNRKWLIVARNIVLEIHKLDTQNACSTVETHTWSTLNLLIAL